MNGFLRRKAPELRRRILLVLVAGIPLLFLRVTYDPINVPKLSLLVIGVGAALGLRIAEWGQGMSAEGIKRLAVPATAMATPLIVAWVLSPYRGWSLFGNYPRFTGLLPYLVAILLGVLLADAFAGRAEQIGWALLAAGGVAGAYAALQFAGVDPFSWSVKGAEVKVVASTLGNSNFAGSFFAIVLPIGLALLVLEPDRRRFSIPLLALTAIGWLAASSQIAWAAGLAGLAIVGGSLLAGRNRAAPLAGVAVAGSAALAVVGAIAFSGFLSDIVPVTLERRSEWWQASMSMSADAPILGNGPGSFALEHTRYRTVEDAAQVTFDIIDDPHSIFFSFLTGAGAFGVIGLLAAAAWIFREGWRSRETLLAAAFFGATVAYFVQALAGVDTVALRSMFWCVTAGLVTASLPLPDRSPRSPRGRARSKRKVVEKQPATALPLALLGTAIAFLGAWWGVSSTINDARFLSGQNAIDGGRFEEGRSATEQAIAFRGEPIYRRELGRDLGRISLALAEGEQAEAAETFREDAVEEFDYTEELPHSNSIVDLARILRDWNEYDESVAARALDSYTRAVRLDPVNPALLGEAGEFARTIRAYEDIENMLQPTAEEVDTPLVWGLLGLAEAHLGSATEAEAAIERALALDPSEENAIQAQEVLARDAG